MCGVSWLGLATPSRLDGDRTRAGGGTCCPRAGHGRAVLQVALVGAGRCPPPAPQRAGCGVGGTQREARTARGPSSAATCCMTTNSRVKPQRGAWRGVRGRQPRHGPALPGLTTPGLRGCLSADTAQLPGVTWSSLPRGPACSTDTCLLPGRREGLQRLFSRQLGSPLPAFRSPLGALPADAPLPPPGSSPPGQRTGLGRELRPSAPSTLLCQGPRPEAAPARTGSSCCAKPFLRAKGSRPPHTSHRWSHWMT